MIMIENEQMIMKKIVNVMPKELAKEKEKTNAFFVLHADENRYNDPLKDLNSSACHDTLSY